MKKIIVSFVRWIRKFEFKLRLNAVIEEFKKNTTLVGSNHNITVGSSAHISYGSTKNDIELHDHCEVISSSLSSINGGKIYIGEWAKLGPNCRVEAVNGIYIGKDSAIAKGATIIDNNSHPICPADRRYMRHTPHGSLERSPQYSANAPIRIGENVWIGTMARICKGVTIGDNAIIAACSVVTHDVPANAIAAGNPARIVKENIDKCTTPIFPLN